MNSQRPKALVTGASSGIGYATAIELGMRGYDVACHYCSNEKGAQEAAEQVRLVGGGAFIIQADVRKKINIDTMVETTLATFGRMDVLVNNAGALGERVAFMDITEEHWNDKFSLLVNSVVFCAQAAAKTMRKQKSGSIINVTSLAARNGGPVDTMAYTAAKSAVLCLTKTLAKELIPHGIRVNGVAPGLIDTLQHERFTPPEMMKEFISRVPMKRTGNSSEVATVIAFLASSDSSYMIGQTLDVNGGLWMS